MNNLLDANTRAWAWREMDRSGARSFFTLGVMVFEVALWAFTELFLLHQLEFAAVTLMGLGALAIEIERGAMHRITDYRQSMRDRAMDRRSSRAGV